MTQPHMTPVFHAVPLTPEAFHPFGEVVEHGGAERRHYLDTPFQHRLNPGEFKIWVSRITERAPAHCRLTTLERHPRAAQTFIPLSNTPYLVVVAPSLLNGLPDLVNIKAFVASGHQGVSYRPDVWHHGLSAFDAPAQFVIMMATASDGVDDEFLPLDEPISVQVPESLLNGGSQ